MFKYTHLLISFIDIISKIVVDLRRWADCFGAKNQFKQAD